jgi:hypothetical protein
MHVTVRLHPECVFDVGERTPETRALVKQYVKAFMDFAGQYAGRPPGTRQVRVFPPAYVWTDANWRVGYTVEESGGTVTITIGEVKMRSVGGRR